MTENTTGYWLDNDWIEVRQSAPFCEIINSGDGGILVHVDQRDEAPKADVPTIRIEQGNSRVFGREFAFCSVWLKAAKGSAKATVLLGFHKV